MSYAATTNAKASAPELWYNHAMSETYSNAALDRLLVPLAECLTPEVAQRIVDMRADTVTQRRLDELAAKANEGRLTGDEQDEYHAYVEAIDLVTVFQAKARTFLDSSAAS